jgi:hypothetical protein
MIFKTRPNNKKQFNTQHNFGINNLIVSGCSFTHNNHDIAAVTWPYYLKDIGGFNQVFDCSLPGAGNHHICNSLQWALEMDNTSPSDSLVIVMWSGYDRDDYICPDTNIRSQLTYPFKFHYSSNIESAITGGTSLESKGNTINYFKEFSLTKTRESRAIENYLYILGLWNYLTVNNYKFLFLNYKDYVLPNRTEDFDIKEYLPKDIISKLNSMITNITSPYVWALKNDLLSKDNFHPSPDGHLDWTRKILLPKLQTILT